MSEWRKGVGKGEPYASPFLYLECILTGSEGENYRIMPLFGICEFILACSFSFTILKICL